MYIKYAFRDLSPYDIHNLYFYVVVVLHIVVGTVGLSTTNFNGKWRRLALNEINETELIKNSVQQTAVANSSQEPTQTVFSPTGAEAKAKKPDKTKNAGKKQIGRRNS
jgi:hypothetical protein